MRLPPLFILDDFIQSNFFITTKFWPNINLLVGVGRFQTNSIMISGKRFIETLTLNGFQLLHAPTLLSSGSSVNEASMLIMNRYIFLYLSGLLKHF